LENLKNVKTDKHYLKFPSFQSINFGQLLAYLHADYFYSHSKYRVLFAHCMLFYACGIFESELAQNNTGQKIVNAHKRNSAQRPGEVYSVSQKNPPPPLRFSGTFSQTVGNF